MTVLVTGGAGYIGAQTVRALRERGEAVVVLDNLETGHREAIGDTPLHLGDIADEALVGRIFAEWAIDAVIHFAAYKAPGESMADPGRYFGNNVAGTLALLRGATRAGVRRFVFSSSCSVYGTPGTLPVSETSATHPESPYAASKLMVEELLGWYERCHGLRHVNLRYFNAAGAAPDGRHGEDWSRTANLIPLVIRAALGRGPAVKIYGTDYPTSDGTAVRDYVHVADLADAHLRALDWLRAQGRSTTVNLGTGRGASVREVVELVESVGSVPVPIEYAPRRPGDPVAIWADAARAREVLGWVPRFGLPEIVRTAWRWHTTHPEGYGSSAGEETIAEVGRS